MAEKGKGLITETVQGATKPARERLRRFPGWLARKGTGTGAIVVSGQVDGLNVWGNTLETLGRAKDAGIGIITQVPAHTDILEPLKHSVATNEAAALVTLGLTTAWAAIKYGPRIWHRMRG